MPRGPQRRLAAIALVLVAVAAGGCGSGGETTAVGQNSAGTQVQPGAKNPDSAIAADALPNGGDAPSAQPAESLAVDAAASRVAIDNFTFTPQTLTVPVGTKVTWVNHDDVPHSVTSTEKKFNSKLLDTDEKFSFTFTAAGEYPYFCGIHPHMTGKIVVK